MDIDLVGELLNCLDRYWRTMKLSPAERAPFSAGIAKLETRIEQLRAATGLDTDQFVKRIQDSLQRLYGDGVPMDALGDDEFCYVASCLDRAGAFFRDGYQQDALAALSDLDRFVDQIKKTPRQEVLRL